MPQGVTGASPLRVLVAGSDADAVAFLTAVVNRSGMRAVATTPAHAATAANAEPPGVVLVDRDLEPVRSIRALADPKKAAIPIVVLGADGASEADATDARAAGATHFVERPIAETTLLNGLRAILGEA